MVCSCREASACTCVRQCLASVWCLQHLLRFLHGRHLLGLDGVVYFAVFGLFDNEPCHCTALLARCMSYLDAIWLISPRCGGSGDVMPNRADDHRLHESSCWRSPSFRCFVPAKLHVMLLLNIVMRPTQSLLGAAAALHLHAGSAHCLIWVMLCLRDLCIYCKGFVRYSTC
jgi:hypothetical protein